MTLAIAMAMMAHVAHHKPQATTNKQVRPLGQYGNWFSAKDYPRDATIARQQGTTAFELQVDPTGLPSDCRITSSSGSKSLDDQTCTIMMSRARFKPARNANGKAVPTVFRHSMQWKLPGRYQENTADRSFDARSVIAPTGEVVSCKLSGAGASKIATAGGSCGPFGNRDFFLFFLHEDYKKVRATNVRMTIVFNGAAPPPLDRPPNFLKDIAKSSIEISPAGEMKSCAAIAKLDALGHTLDLCDFIRADPPHFPRSPTARKAVLLLQLSAYYL